jgi:large subunit ribosomal protein L24
MSKKLHIKTGDQVRVIAGESKGKEGRVVEVFIDKNRAIVEGINMVSRHTKPSAQSPDGGIVKKEAPLHLSNLMLIDAEGNATRVGRRADKDGKLVRFSKKSGEDIKS